MSLRSRIQSLFFPQRDRTRTYRPTDSGAIGFWMNQDRPPFSLWQIEQMVLDHQVHFGLSIGNGALLSAQVEVKAESREIAQYVQAQWDKIWSNYARKLLESKAYGYGGFELTYTLDDDRIGIDSLRDYGARDVNPRTRGGKLIGFTVRGMHDPQAGGVTGIHAPKSLWLTHESQYGRFYGRSELRAAYDPWWEKTMQGGAKGLRRLRMVKDAWVGDQLKYPMGRKTLTPDGVEINWRDVAREIGESRASGGVICIPSDCDVKTGKPLVEYIPPTSVEGATQISDWVDDLDWDIFDGLLIPREVVEAAMTGSGFSGRTIPFLSFLSMHDGHFLDIVRQIKEQTLDCLVWANFGKGRKFTVKPVALLATIGEKMGDMGQPNMQSDTGGQRQHPPENGQNPQWQRNGQPPASNQPAPQQAAPIQLSVSEFDAVQFATAHAPAGGISIAGQQFTGGEFIPGSTLAKATPQEKAALGVATQATPRKQSPTPKPTAPPRASRQLVPTTSINGRLSMADGSPLPEHLAKLKLPPAWKNVAVSLDPHAELLAQGYDAKGRKQSVYSDSFASRQAAKKFSRISELIRKAQTVFGQTKAATQDSDHKRREAASVMLLIQATGLRPGSERDTKSKVQAYGATTLLGKHVIDTGQEVRLQFIGKKGVPLDIPIRDPEVAAMLRSRKNTTGDAGKLFDVSDGELRQFSHTLNGGSFRPKDFRTLKGTSLAIQAIQAAPQPPTNEKEYKQRVREVAKIVSSALGNTPTVALQSYIDPSVFALWRPSAA